MSFLAGKTPTTTTSSTIDVTLATEFPPALTTTMHATTTISPDVEGKRSPALSPTEFISQGYYLDEWPVLALSRVDACTWISDCQAPGQVPSPTNHLIKCHPQLGGDSVLKFLFFWTAFAQVEHAGPQPSNIPDCLCLAYDFLLWHICIWRLLRKTWNISGK